MTFPVTKRQIREVIKDAHAKGLLSLDEFKEATKKNKSGYCVNWADLSLLDVSLKFDEEGVMTLCFEFEEGECELFRAHMYDRLKDAISSEFRVEVDISW